MNTQLHCPACGCSESRRHDNVLACNNCGHIWTPDLYSLKTEVERLREALQAVAPLLSDETTAKMEPDGRYILRPKMPLSDLREAKRKFDALSLTSPVTA